MERMTWMTEERSGAPVTGAPRIRRAPVAMATSAGFPIQKQAGLVSPAHGPGLVCGSSTVTFRTNDHVATGRIAWHGAPLGSSGDGYG